ncbi:MAG: phytoene desaturase family protein [Acidobacteriota bacterium]
MTDERSGTVASRRARRPGHSVVVGGGFGGIAAALRLRAQGGEVTLVDRLPELGGRARVFRRGGFTFDAGPTVITAPFLFEELFALFGKQLEDYATLVPVEPWYRMMFDDGSTFDYGGSVEDTLAEIERFEPRDREGYLTLLAHSRRLFEKGFEELADRPFSSWRDMLRVLPDLLRLRADRTVFDLVSRHLKDPRLRQAFSLHPLLVGGNPFTTTSIYSLIHSLERRWGIHFPLGGTGALVSALGRLMEEQGVQVRLGTTVERIDVAAGGSHRGRARGVVLEDGEVISADRVVAAADPAFVYRHLVEPRHRRRWSDRRIDRMRLSMGLFVLYFGTDRTYPDVAHHTILFGPRYRELLEDIFQNRELAPDFSLYLHRPTATDPSLAPAGHDGFYVLSPVPHLGADIDWPVEGPRYRERILEHLEGRLLPNLRRHLVDDFWVTPRYFQDELLSHRGAGFSVQPILRQSAWFRFHNRSEDIDGLYFVGAGTHPGAGVPGVLSSAKVLTRVLADEAVDR